MASIIFISRATIYAEAWGSRYDFSQYSRVYPRSVSISLKTPRDLDRIGEVSPTAGPFEDHLKLVQKIKAGIGGAH